MAAKSEIVAAAQTLETLLQNREVGGFAACKGANNDGKCVSTESRDTKDCFDCPALSIIREQDNVGFNIYPNPISNGMLERTQSGKEFEQVMRDNEVIWMG